MCLRVSVERSASRINFPTHSIALLRSVETHLDTAIVTAALDAKSLHFVYTMFMATETTTVRVRRPDSERLQLIARARQASVIDVVHDAIDALERRDFLHGLNEDYQRLRSDPEQWERYVAERTEWDALA